MPPRAADHPARGGTGVLAIASLRRVALGRKNYRFVGDVEAGASIAGLYTLVATCEARGINPFAYLANVIPRVQDHPKRRLDELLPGPWARAHATA